MTFSRGRPSRPDDWPSSHVRARAGLSERLDGALDPAEAGWLGEHLAACPACATIATEYAEQRLQLRALRERMPEPPRDLWARTAAAIESEAGFRDRDRRRRRTRASLAPFAVLSAAVAVAVIVGSLTSSQRPGGDGTARPSLDVAARSAAASGLGSPAAPGATPLIVAQKVEWISRDAPGRYRVNVANVDEVCPPDSSEPCDTAAPTEDRPVVLQDELASAWGSPDGDSIIVVNEGTRTGGAIVSVVPLASDAVASPTPTPNATPSPTPTASPSTVASAAVSGGPASLAPSLAPSRPPSTQPSLRPSTGPSTGPSVPPASSSPSIAPPSAPPSSPATPSPSVAVSPSAEPGTIEIARDVVVVGQSAAYSPDGNWFAFTARPANGSTGPDIYVWTVGSSTAEPATTDHRSVFASWSGDTIVGSRVAETAAPSAGPPGATETSSFLLDPATRATTDAPGLTRMWRPAVDPTGRQAIYWAGSVRESDGSFIPEAGRLVLGAWSAATPSGPIASADPPPAGGRETTIAAGKLADWDARWDGDGTHVAVWIADGTDSTIGRLSLYGVDAFDGRIDLQQPLLDAHVATAGFAISEGKLVWAEPAPDGSADGGTIRMLAWTAEGSGQVESLPGPVIVIR